MANKTILVIDDDSDLLQSVSIRLRKIGYEVLNAADGVQGALLAGLHRPALIILDIGLPGISGHLVAKHLKNTGETYQIPILMLTGESSLDDHECAFNIGVESYFVKPYEASELMSAVHNLAPLDEMETV